MTLQPGPMPPTPARSGEFSADLVVSFDSEREAKVAYEALLPEFSSEFPRVRRAFEVEGSKIHLRLDAKDPASLRAGLNSYMRWMRTSMEIQQIAKESRAQPEGN